MSDPIAVPVGREQVKLDQVWNAPDGRSLRVVGIAADRVGVRNTDTGRLSYMSWRYFDPRQKWHLTLESALSAALAPPPQLPCIEWEGPDEDGDLIVHLKGVEFWHVSAHGATKEIALARLGESMLLCYRSAPNCISTDPPGAALVPPVGPSPQRETAAIAALRLIARGGCHRLTVGWCLNRPEWTPDAEYSDERWCLPCIARSVLELPIAPVGPSKDQP